MHPEVRLSEQMVTDLGIPEKLVMSICSSPKDPLAGQQSIGTVGFIATPRPVTLPGARVMFCSSDIA
jgi:hypothetical protein